MNSLFKKWVRSSLNIKHIVTIIATTAFFVVAMIFSAEQIETQFRYLSFLSSRNYSYSVVINKDIGTDCYLLYNRKVLFATDDSLDKTINAVVLMEIGNEHTQNDFLYDYPVASLKENEIAVSQNLAFEHDLEIGSIVYSKNKYSDSVKEYTIRLILPSILGVAEDSISESKGVLVMGKDTGYINGIITDCIYYYGEDYSLINQQGAMISGQLYSKNASIKNAVGNFILNSLMLLFSCGICCLIFFGLLIGVFNHNVYLKKKEFGMKTLYRALFADIFVYYLLLLIPVLTITALVCYKDIPIHSCMLAVFVATAGMLISYFTEKHRLKGR